MKNEFGYKEWMWSHLDNIYDGGNNGRLVEASKR